MGGLKASPVHRGLIFQRTYTVTISASAVLLSRPQKEMLCFYGCYALQQGSSNEGVRGQASSSIPQGMERHPGFSRPYDPLTLCSPISHYDGRHACAAADSTGLSQHMQMPIFMGRSRCLKMAILWSLKVLKRVMSDDTKLTARFGITKTPRSAGVYLREVQR